MTYEYILHHPEVLALLERGNHNLGVLGFTDHSIAHCALVADRAGYILRKLGYSEREQELAKIAGIMHDIGNAINRKSHAELGAILANDILKATDMPLEDRICVIAAIGNHDESTGGAKDPVSAALILADKADVRRNRVRSDPEKFDIHDRVNYAVTGSSLKVDPVEKKIALNLQVDESICTMYEYFDIFLGRMLMCRGAAEMLGCQFRLTVNGGKVL
ncbi:MAG: HD domain-containing protein [Oscillospiraceae bacterium]|nr:HD domain-containing protein [Oscillospiraceae bacterium]MBQ5712009.1 HD domain-containing protein [Oscillospiraceae bacterium]